MPVTKILIIDDEPNIRLVFRTTLERPGCEVVEAKDGEEALELLKEVRPALVILDLQMPRMGGMELLRRLREAGDETPVIIVTAHGSIPDAVAAMRLGAIDFLTKPMSTETLRAVVGQVLARHAEPEGGREPFPTPTPAQRTGTTAVLVAEPMIDLTAAKRALNRREFDRAADLLEEALDLDPASAEAHTQLGGRVESRGQDHAAYHAYRRALEADPEHGPALDNLRRYCERFGIDFLSKAINPAAD